MNRKTYNILADEELVKMAQEGSATAEEFLINKYKELAKVKATKYFIIGGDRDDVIQEGMIGIFKAIREFREDKNASFRTFAEICINRQIISAIRKANLKKHKPLNEFISLNQEQNSDEGEKSLEESLMTKNEDDPEALLLMQEIVDFLKEDSGEIFSPLEKNVWERMLQGRKYKEIATELNKSSKSVDNAMQRIKKKIYGYLGY